MGSLMVFLGLLCATISTIYIFLVWNYNYWRKRGVKGPKPLPYIGNFPSYLTQKRHFAEEINDYYKEYRNKENFVGVYAMRVPQLVILDPSHVREILVTSFKNFHVNVFSQLCDPKKDYILGLNPFASNGEPWKERRNIVSQGLSNVRIKASYSAMYEVCERMFQYIDAEMSSKNYVNARTLCTKFVNENICHSVLGVQANSFTDNPIPLAENVNIAFVEKFRFVIFTLIAGLVPKLYDYYRLRMIPKEVDAFFNSFLQQTLDMRRESNIDRQDYMDYIIKLKEKKNLEDKELICHIMTLIFDTIETSGNVLIHFFYLMAKNPECQQKLFEEINKNKNVEGILLSFEQIVELPYLEGCIIECLRIYPPTLYSNKVCTAPTTLSYKDGRELKLEVGQKVLIPVYAIHHDPSYYPEPEVYKPERFLPEFGGAKKYREMGLFLGFSVGPRMCMGMRFALVQMKVVVASILSRYQVKLHEKTSKDMKIDPKAFLCQQYGDILIKFEKRT